MKSIVYTSPITSIKELKSRITSAIRSIDGNMLRNVWENTKTRFHYIVTTRGSHIEHLTYIKN